MKVVITSAPTELEKLAKLMMFADKYNEGRLTLDNEDDAVAVVNILKSQGVEFDCDIQEED